MPRAARVRIDNATCVLPDGTRTASVLFERGTILDIDPAPTAEADEVIDATGLHLLPGVIDHHVHFRDPGLTHKEDLHTASLACAKGGVTSFVEMPNTVPPAITQAEIDHKLELASQKSVVNYGFYIAASTDNLDALINAKRVAGIKIFIGSSTGNLYADDQDTLEASFAKTALPICAHCEDEPTVQANAARLDGGRTVHDHSRIRDHEAAIRCTTRACDLATHHNHRFHVLHGSTAQELDIIKAHAGVVTGEACPHHLWFSIDDYDRLGTRIQMNPAVKNREDVVALWEGLRSGILCAVVTDHAPHTLEEKAQPYPKSPSGLPAIENSLALMLTAMHDGKCTLEQIVHWMCESPATIWDMVGKGRLVPGNDADGILVDLDRRHTVRDAEQVTKCKWSAWDGEELRGQVVRTIVGGVTVFEEGRFNDSHRGSPIRYGYEQA
ncbi:MAG: dihydroorotase [Phycisphaerales bacterium]